MNQNTKKSKSVSELFQLITQKGTHQEISKNVLRIITDIASSNLGIIVNWHPLGFLQFKLGKDKYEGSVKLHIWDNGLRSVQNPEWLIHRHVWELSSHVLVGKVTNLTYEVKDCFNKTNECFYCAYDVIFEEQNSILVKTNRYLSCNPLTCQTYAAGEKYSVKSNDFHQTTVPSEDFAATIIYTPPKIRETPLVVGDANGLERYNYERIICKRKVFNQLLKKLEQKLNGNR